MHIIVKSRHSRRHHAERRMEDTVTYRLQAGAAQIALMDKRERPAVDVYGTPLPLARGLAEGYSEKALERLVRQGRLRQ